MEIIIGTKVWSSWSLRAWLVLKRTGAPFEERLVTLHTTASPGAIRAAGSPSGMVPALKDGDLVVWESLAVCEYLAEKVPQAKLWPQDPAARALARAAATEMHAGFHSLRGECPMDLGVRTTADLTEATATDVRRVVELWGGLLKRFGGPFLCGDWSIADAFFTPVATRVRSYGIRLTDYGDDGAAGAYAARLLEEPEFLEWEKDALAAAA
ncbi:MAG TPA: glutathione S-transferase [Caulobacteraceae bacterium]|nr:glutathione S-transferase [Caulobacteraceae bacterium]